MLYEITVPQFIKTLKNLNSILDKGMQFAETKKFDPSVYLTLRLAPDQLDFAHQIQIATDTAKLGIARVTGNDGSNASSTKPAPKHNDTEKTLPEFKSRIESVINYLQSFSAKDFSGAEERRVTTPRWEGKTLSGTEFVIHHVIPNFYFHVTMAYAILRHNGVDIGKKDFLGPIPYKA